MEHPGSSEREESQSEHDFRIAHISGKDAPPARNESVDACSGRRDIRPQLKLHHLQKIVNPTLSIAKSGTEQKYRITLNEKFNDYVKYKKAHDS